MAGSKNFTAYIKPLNIVLDVAAVTVLCHYNFNGLVENNLHLWLYLFATWIIVSYFSGYYRFFRFTTPLDIVYKSLRQFAFYALCVAAFMLFVRYAVFSIGAIVLHIGLLVAISSLFKIMCCYVMKSLPVSAHTGTFIVIGKGQVPEHNKPVAVFNGHNSVAGALAFALKNNINTIYCTITQASPVQIDVLRTYGTVTHTKVRFMPLTKSLHFPKRLQIDYFEEIPLLYPQRSPLDNPVSQLFKRVFDIIFSLLVIVFIFSWMVPLIALFIMAESKGPVFFKQIRVGKDGSEFWCYKFRSMKVNNSEGKVTVKNDPRITKVGAFLRKTSLDEMPQFINVLLGHMSVVGPRPKIWGHHNQYKDHIHKFMDRLNVKPGITGLAQVSGYRGEINSDAEMQNRIRYDVFYNENWSFLLDIRIIVQTVVNIFMGEEKAF